jgi:hypothetical protein
MTSPRQTIGHKAGAFSGQLLDETPIVQRGVEWGGSSSRHPQRSLRAPVAARGARGSAGGPEHQPKCIKGELFAFDAVEVEPLLTELAKHPFIQRYRNEQGRFIQVSKFEEHQTPHYSEKESVIKPPALLESPPHDDHPTPGVLQERGPHQGGRNLLIL